MGREREEKKERRVDTQATKTMILDLQKNNNNNKRSVTAMNFILVAK